jgi:hypothetical protein
MQEYVHAMQSTQNEGESFKTRALEAAHENIVKLAAKDEQIAAHKVGHAVSACACVWVFVLPLVRWALTARRAWRSSKSSTWSTRSMC